MLEMKAHAWQTGMAWHAWMPTEFTSDGTTNLSWQGHEIHEHEVNRILHTLPRPRAAVRATVLRKVFSLAASRKVTTARA